MLAFCYCLYMHWSRQRQNTVNWVFESQDVEFNLSEGKTALTIDSDFALKPPGSRGRTHVQAFRKLGQPHIVLLLILPVRCEAEAYRGKASCLPVLTLKAALLLR